MNTKLLLKVRDRILAEPEHFDMAEYFLDQPCGTTACIAGWTKAIVTRQSLKNCRRSHIWAFARNALGINEEQAKKLFYDDHWPHPFDFNYAEANDNAKELAQIAADRINHFIATNGEE
jgi:hypothetical protein